MKRGLGRKLALENIKKNYRFFIPRILTEAGLLICFYIFFTLSLDGRLSEIKGGSYIPTFMWMGAVIIGLLSLILMLYTNSFLMKQRKREFGMYSVLGMEKKHICRVLFHESLIASIISVVSGLIGGMLFYKISSLAICKLLKTEIVAGFYFITPKTVLPAGAVFIGIDLITYFFNCITIGRSKPTDLISDAHTGEKEPKVKWVLLLVGIVSLGSGYYISLSTDNPLKAILVFFAAVLLVILGTYCLFTAGSIFVLKALKKRRNYYYQPGHITAVSGLLYRMKQNAVGLASIAVLATGVLIMISSTFCLYFRTEGIIDTFYPQDYYVPMSFEDENKKIVSLPEDLIVETVCSAATAHGLDISTGFSQRFFEVSFSHQPGKLIADREFMTTETDYNSLCNLTLITEDTYIKLGGKPLGLTGNEVAVSSLNIAGHFEETAFTMFGKEYSVTKEMGFFPIQTHLISVNCFGMIVADDTVYNDIFASQKKAYGDNASVEEYRYCVSFKNKDRALTVGNDFSKEVESAVDRYIGFSGHTSYSIGKFDSFWSARENLYGMYGTLMFLGFLLGMVCLFAAVLIIYYKQISEGYEDRERYQIMRKIGMTEKEVKKTIKDQIMLVFFLPLITAGIHVAFAYPILTKLMEVLLLDNAWLFAKWCIIIYLIFAAVYAVIYKLTAKTYYKIVY